MVRLHELGNPPISLGALLSSEVEAAIGERRSETAADAQQQVLDGMRGQDPVRALLGLSAEQRHILARRFGLDGKERQKLGEIGAELALSTQRVHQIQLAAAKRMREILTEFGYGPH